MRVISVMSEKGGVSKTTTSVNLAKGLSDKGMRVLLIDLDPQGNATRYFMDNYRRVSRKEFIGDFHPQEKDLFSVSRELKDFIYSHSEVQKDINTVLSEEALDNPEIVRECIMHTDVGGTLDVIPSLRHELINTSAALTVTNRVPFSRLKHALREVRREYDVAIIDNAPTYNIITINALLVSQDVIIPLPVGISELEGFVTTVENIEQFERDQDLFDIRVHVLMTMIHRGKRPEQDLYISKLKEIFPECLYETTIGYQDSIASRTAQVGSFILDTDSRIGGDYRSLIEEIGEGGEG